MGQLADVHLAKTRMRNRRYLGAILVAYLLVLLSQVQHTRGLGPIVFISRARRSASHNLWLLISNMIVFLRSREIPQRVATS